ncbi:MAG: T9SS type B sorting domain-containing protein [Gelidibacter sp.]
MASISFSGYAQLGFCTGNSGDPIFMETFGTGTTDGPALSPGTTSYQYVGSASPEDGQYTVTSTSNYFDWHNTPDHTPNDSNGKMFVVNADFTAGEFFRRTITGLCEITSYEFSSWLINLLPTSGCSGSGIPINVKFQIWDDTDTTLLASGDTGNIPGTTSPNWQQYGLTFQTLPAQTAVILKMINNGNGGCGNDLAIDDIIFKTCGDNIVIEDAQTNNTIVACEQDTPLQTQLSAIPDFSIYTTHVYQWQESSDNVVWTDILGETNQTFTTPALTTTTYYRVKVAEDAVNLANPQCSSLSDVFEIQIVPQPAAPTSDGDIVNCGGQSEILSVSVPADVTVNWYDTPNGGNPLLENSSTFETDIAGTYYAEAVSDIGDCVSNSRTAVQVTFLPAPIVEDESTFICEGETTTLFANSPNNTYVWSTGDTVSQTTVDAPGIYTVIVTNGSGCSVTKTVTVTQIDRPIIGSIFSDGNDLVITTENSGDFEYSLDGTTYQLSNTFFNAEGGLYTVYVRERNGCGVATQEYIHFVIPKFFTPNGDTENELFILKGIEFFNQSEVYIFDRYGSLLISSKNQPFYWDGTFKNKALPSSDYWYVIKIDGQEFKGHFTLKR